MSDNLSHDRPNTWIYRLAHTVVSSYFRLFYRIRVEGLENVPRRGGVILASNHLSNFDPPLIGIVVPRYIRFMGKAELFSLRPIAKLFSSLGGFPIHRGKIDRQAIRTAIDIVQTGGCLVMFPEGHRSRTGELGELMPGILSIAKKSGGLVVPTAIVGRYRMFGSLTVKFGSPIAPEEFSSEDGLDRLAASLRNLIAAG
ncbi:lysophospholipid acyltransferase family protein [Alicyclobacillus acidiphilus]|uniref:lysophospholipid acyltransferase family protein n=1 Tax=Alicyclobacillus acidiphilus TaxID=182455 RepID=UPI0009FAF2E4|nr:lysophospholipid acyltransferase family protein [Alicyclobacillus acidiphilus]